MRTIRSAPSALVCVLCLLSGCGGGKIDTSSEEAMKTSIQKVKDGLPADKREEFERAMMAIAMSGMEDGNIFALAADKGGLERRMKDRLNGKTADEVFAEAEKVRADAKARSDKEAAEAEVREARRASERRAEQVTQVEGQLAELKRDVKAMETRRAAAELAKEKLKGFKVERSRFYRSTGDFRSGEPVIELTIKNSLGQAVSRAYFRGVLATPGRAMPWVDDDFNYSITGGMEPGESDTWNLSPNMFGEWTKAPRDREDMVLTVTVLRVDGADGKAIFDAEFDKGAQAKLDSHREEITKLEGQLSILKE